MAPAQHNPAPTPAPAHAKKGKGKKPADPSEQQKQIQAKIAQLELDAAGDKEQELEVGGSSLSVVRGLNRVHTSRATRCVCLCGPIVLPQRPTASRSLLPSSTGIG